MTTLQEAAASKAVPVCDTEIGKGPGQIVLVFQGGGALGAYQAGVYQALHEAGIEPDWVIGTSIGAINASLIAGNSREDRLPRLHEFWHRVQRKPTLGATASWPGVFEPISDWATFAGGVSGFFRPNPFALLGANFPLGPELAGFYSTAPLEATLSDFVDFTLLNRGSPRLTIGAANVRTSDMHYFDTRKMPLTVKHVMASASLPPAFPAVCIDGEYYWDGGILSNTPTEAIFDDYPRRDSLVFVVNVWNPTGPEPKTIWDVLHRHKDIQYSSRVVSHIARQQQLHRLRHVISQLAAHITEPIRATPEVGNLLGYGCVTRMHFVPLLAPRLANEGHNKDIDFSASAIRARWDAGFAHTQRALELAPWKNEFDSIEGVILHEPITSPPSE